MTAAHIRASIEKVATAHGLEADLVEAVVLTESSGNTFANKPETKYPYLMNVRTWKPFRPLTASERVAAWAPDDFPTLAGHRDQEWQAQRTSWGLMQVMGAVAREHGFRGLYLVELVEVVANLQIGCRHLAGFLTWTKGDVDKALRAYNGGRGGVTSPATEDYPVKVRGFLNQIKGGRA